MKKKLIAASIIYAFWLAVFYMGASFYFTSFDPVKWSEDGRYVFADFGIGVGALAFVMAFFWIPSNYKL